MRRRDTMWRMGEEAQLRRKKVAVGRSDLQVSNPSDAQELVADKVAKKVVSGETAIVDSGSNAGSLQPKADSGGVTASAELQNTLDSSKGGGQALDDATKSMMGEQMGADLSGVKIHNDNTAHQMSESINAKAFTHGEDIYFKQGNYNTSSTEGRELLAHELAHTVQQKGNVNRKIQRKAYRPQKVADDYFKGVAGYSFQLLKKYMGSDGTGDQNKQLQDLLSAIIYMNKDTLTPTQVWEQITIDPTQLRGYDAFFVLNKDEQRLPKFSRTAATLQPGTYNPTELTELATGTVEYSIRKNFLVRKKKREQKRQVANAVATSYLQNSTGKLQAISNEVSQDKLELEQKVQELLNTVNTSLSSEGFSKEQLVSEKIAFAKTRADAAKFEITRYFHGSNTVIGNNTKDQKTKLDLYYKEVQDKMMQLKDDQQASINTLYLDFKNKVNTMLPGFTKTVRDAGRKRYESHQSNGMFTLQLDQVKGEAAVKASQEAEVDLIVLADETISSAFGKSENEAITEYSPSSYTKEDFDAQLIETAGSFGYEITQIYFNTLQRLDDKAVLDKQAADMLREEYINHVDEITLGIIQALTDVLKLHYVHLDQFGDKQDSLINDFYVRALDKLISSSNEQLGQSKLNLETFKSAQQGQKTPKAEQLGADIASSESQLSPLIEKASLATKEQHAKNTANFDTMGQLVIAELEAISEQNTLRIDLLMQTGFDNLATAEKAGVDAQLQLRVDHLNEIISDVNSGKKQMDIQVNGFYETNQQQLADIRENLRLRLLQFETDANKIIQNLDKRMDEAESQAETEYYMGKWHRKQNVKNFKELQLKLYGTDEVYKLVKKLMDDSGYSDLEGFSAILGSWLFSTSYSDEISEINKLAAEHSFSSCSEYVDTLIEFEKAFRLAASALTLQYIDDTQQMLYKTREDLRNPTVQKNLFEKLNNFRKKNLEKEENEISVQIFQKYTREHGSVLYTGSTDDRRERTEDEENLYHSQRAKQPVLIEETRNELRVLYEEFPVLNDESFPLDDRLNKHELGRASDPSAMAKVILLYIEERIAASIKCRETVIEDEGTDDVYSMDQALPSIINSFGLDPKTFPGSLIQDKIDAKRKSELIWGIITAIFVLALIILTGPVGLAIGGTALTTIAGVTALTISITSAFEAIEKYEHDSALAGMGLASEPSFIWVVLAIVGAALDIGPLLKSVKTIKALNVALIDLDAIGVANLPAFRTAIETMMKSGELDMKMGKIILNSVDGRMGYLNAVTEFNTLSKTTSKISPKLLQPLTKMAYFKIKEGAANFEQYLTIVKRALKTEVLEPGQLTLYKEAFRAGQQGLETGVTRYADEVIKIGEGTGDDLADSFEDWVNTLETQTNPRASIADGEFERFVTGSDVQYRAVGGGQIIWADGVEISRNAIIDAKHNVGNFYTLASYQAKPFMYGSLESEFIRYSSVINDTDNPAEILIIYLSREDQGSRELFEHLGSRFNVNVRVEVRPWP